MLIRTLISRDHDLTSPPIKGRGRKYHVQIETTFTVQYGFVVPYRTCAIAQARHPGELRVSALEVLSLLLLAIECHNNAPNELVYTVSTTFLPSRKTCTLLIEFRYVCLRLILSRCED